MERSIRVAAAAAPATPDHRRRPPAQARPNRRSAMPKARR
ncbi:hypothetical protein GLE_3481 [Lysobacter enzymogenes]|uniref:Uncharacterized protein n=1 Tax=Lysobacter enzymogenes TaxID=69 RepID=A0A0S2DJW0_LYSEN|nr:hypothetical protein GLE_3481 [Lysobacter enzymogenes]